MWHFFRKTFSLGSGPGERPGAQAFFEISLMKTSLPGPTGGVGPTPRQGGEPPHGGKAVAELTHSGRLRPREGARSNG